VLSLNINISIGLDMAMARKIKNASFNSDSKKLEVLVALFGSRFGDIL
jgi:hypothetical protein